MRQRQRLANSLPSGAIKILLDRLKTAYEIDTCLPDASVR